jgi:hypothetical protein
MPIVVADSLLRHSRAVSFTATRQRVQRFDHDRIGISPTPCALSALRTMRGR